MALNTFRRKARSDEGSAIVEFALTAMILIVLLFGMWDFGRLFDAWLVITNAAREGARYGAVYGVDQNKTQAEVVSLVKDKTVEYLRSGFTNRPDVEPYSVNDVTVTFPDSYAIGQRVQVTAAVRVDLWPLISSLFFGGANWATIRGGATMRM